jgi:hypothetical protein
MDIMAIALLEGTHIDLIMAMQTIIIMVLHIIAITTLIMVIMTLSIVTIIMEVIPTAITLQIIVVFIIPIMMELIPILARQLLAQENLVHLCHIMPISKTMISKGEIVILPVVIMEKVMRAEESWPTEAKAGIRRLVTPALQV